MIASLTATAKLKKIKQMASLPSSQQGRDDSSYTSDSKGYSKNSDAINEINSGSATPQVRQLEWVQCDACKKWRTLPLPTHSHYPTQLSDDKAWICSMNLWAPHLANCSAPEVAETTLSDTAIKIRVWLRKLRSADRYDSKSSSGSRGDRDSKKSDRVLSQGDRHKPGEVEWVRCCSASCGKWRAVPRSFLSREKTNQV